MVRAEQPKACIMDLHQVSQLNRTKRLHVLTIEQETTLMLSEGRYTSSEEETTALPSLHHMALHSHRFENDCCSKYHFRRGVCPIRTRPDDQ